MKAFWTAVWANLKAFFKWVALKIAAPGVALIIVVGAIVLVALGFKELQIGGLLGRLLGRAEPGKKAIDVVNTIPKGRVDAHGNLIPLGQPDAGGNTQVQVVPIDPPGIFSNPDHVTYTPPGSFEPVVIKLPTGVKAKDVEQVVVVSPEVTVVTVKDSSGVTPTQVDDLLKKYAKEPA